MASPQTKKNGHSRGNARSLCYGTTMSRAYLAFLPPFLAGLAAGFLAAGFLVAVFLAIDTFLPIGKDGTCSRRDA